MDGFESFVRFKKKQITRAQESSQRYGNLHYQSLQNNDRENKVSSYKKLALNAQKQAQFFQAELDIARPEIPSDIEERLRIMRTYPKLISKNVPDEEPLFFHGVNSIVKLEDILASGHIGYLENEETRSFTAPGMIDVTTKDSIITSINGFVGLNCSGPDRYLPAGCLIVIAPKDDSERAYANQNTGSEHSIPTVDFEKNPNRIVSIVSTAENRDRILELSARYHIDPSKIHTFDSFIDYLSQRHSSQCQIEERINDNTLFRNTRTSETNAQRSTLQRDTIEMLKGLDGKSY